MSRLALPPLLAVLSLSLLLVFFAAPSPFALAQPPFLPPPPPKTGNPACIAATNNLNTGACHVVAVKLRTTASSLKDATCEQLGSSEAARLVTPECCADVRSFVASGCGCDPGVLGLLGAAGVPAAALAGGVKLATASMCASEALGGPLENTCAGAVDCKASSPAAALLPASPASVPVASASSAAAAGPPV